MVYLIVIFSGGFGIIAALMAYLITYREYRHHYPSETEPRQAGRQAALVAFLFFLVLGIASGICLYLFLPR